MPLMAVVAIVLVTYGNAATWLVVEGSLARGMANAAIAAGCLAIARWSGVPWKELGLTTQHLDRGLAWGLIAALAIATPAVAGVLLMPLVFGAPIHYEQVERLGGTALALHVLVQFPLQTAAPEEFAFRGALIGVAFTAWRAWPAQVLVAGAFALSHGVVAAQTITGAGITGHVIWLPLLYVGALGLLFAGGLIFGVLRAWTGSLAAPIVAHWLAVALIRIAVWTAA